MRNLLGRLNARNAEELGRIAAAWQVPVSGNDKLGQVSQLYRALTDLPSVRDLWTRLPEDERKLITSLLARDEHARPLADLSNELGLPEAEVRQIAARLYFKGIVVREGDDEPLPVGQAPRLFLPRELSLLFKRVLDEIAAGDVSGASLDVLVRRLDDRQIEEAAEHWGVRVIPGLRTREEILHQLLANVGNPRRRQAIEQRLKREASRIWIRLRDAPNGAPLPLAEVLAAEGPSGDEPRVTSRWRDALTELEERLLVWHTYRDGESRWLFVPADVRAQGAATVTHQSALPAEIEGVQRAKPASATPFPVAWDLLTLLRALSPPQDHAIDEIRNAPRGWLKQVNDGLWNSGSENAPPAGYLDFLIELARMEGVLTGGDPAVEEPFVVQPTVRAWRDRTFPDQAARLRAHWLGSASWIEGSENEEIEIFGADWPGFRLKLIAHLALLKRESWYSLEAVANWLAQRDPDLLGASFDATSARNPPHPNDEAANRRAAIATVAAATLTTAFAWMGLAELGATEKGELAVRFLPDQPHDAPPPVTNPGLAVTEKGEISLRDATPLRVWSLTAFADLISLGETTRYRISERSVKRALKAGFERKHIESFLTRQTGEALPAALLVNLQTWTEALRRVRLTRTLRLVADTDEEAEALQALLQTDHGEIVRVGTACFVTIEGDSEANPTEASLMTRLSAAGFAPQGLDVSTTIGTKPSRQSKSHPKR